MLPGKLNIIHCDFFKKTPDEDFINYELDEEWNIDLKRFVRDKQKIDNYISEFYQTSYGGRDLEYSISGDGEFKFQGFIDKKYNLDVTVTDGEAVRTYQFY